MNGLTAPSLTGGWRAIAPVCPRSLLSKSTVRLMVCDWGERLRDFRPKSIRHRTCTSAHHRSSGARSCSAKPRPGYQSFGAWLRHDLPVTVTGDAIVQAQALGGLERLVELARPETANDPVSDVARDPDRIVRNSRHLHLVDGRQCAIHWTEAGTGVPVVFLHTAGADCRQYAHQLADTELQQRYRMFAFDMPWHGQSGGVNGVAEPDSYTLNRADYFAWCDAFLSQIVGEPAIIVGCSMGAAMALTLAADIPDRLLGCVTLEAPLTAPGRASPLLADARVANGTHNPAYVRALLSPTAPQRFRDEACAIYAQALPGIYLGDLKYYSQEYDGAELAPALRAGNLRIELLTGSYDYSASPDNTRALLAMIERPGVTFTEMEGLGHFPMIEAPDRFRPYLLEALDRIDC